MGLSTELEKKKFDTRLIDWNLKHNRIKREDLDQHLRGLPDSSQNVETFSFSSDMGIDDGDIDDDMDGAGVLS